MKLVFTIIFLFAFGKSFSQKNIVVIERNCLDNSCSQIKKLQYTFNQKGQIQEYIIFGDYHNPDTNYVANTSKFTYDKSKILERVNYSGKHLDSKINYSYTDNRLSTVKYNNSITKYFYNNKDKVSFTLMLEGLDTLRTVKYTYKKNELTEIFRYNNEIENERTIYSKLNDTIVETLIRHDSINLKEPWVYVVKKKYDGRKLIYRSNNIEQDNTSEENLFSYDSTGEIRKIETTSYAKSTEKKEKSEFVYVNGVIHKIEKYELINGVWKPKLLVVYKIEKSLNKKMKKKINQYFVERETLNYE